MKAKHPNLQKWLDAFLGSFDIHLSQAASNGTSSYHTDGLDLSDWTVNGHSVASIFVLFGGISLGRFGMAKNTNGLHNPPRTSTLTIVQTLFRLVDVGSFHNAGDAGGYPRRAPRVRVRSRERSVSSVQRRQGHSRDTAT